MADQDLKTSVKGQILSTSDLPTLPSVLDEVTKLVDDPNSSTEQVAKVISQDQVLSAKVLKWLTRQFMAFREESPPFSMPLCCLA